MIRRSAAAFSIRPRKSLNETCQLKSRLPMLSQSLWRNPVVQLSLKDRYFSPEKRSNLEAHASRVLASRNVTPQLRRTLWCSVTMKVTGFEVQSSSFSLPVFEIWQAEARTLSFEPRHIYIDCLLRYRHARRTGS